MRPKNTSCRALTVAKQELNPWKRRAYHCRHNCMRLEAHIFPVVRAGVPDVSCRNLPHANRTLVRQGVRFQGGAPDAPCTGQAFSVPKRARSPGTRSFLLYGPRGLLAAGPHRLPNRLRTCLPLDLAPGGLADSSMAARAVSPVSRAACPQLRGCRTSAQPRVALPLPPASKCRGQVSSPLTHISGARHHQGGCNRRT